MATTTLVRPGGSDLAEPIQTWRRTATVLDQDGRRLTDVDVLGRPEDGLIEFSDITDPAALIDQCFLRGAPSVLLTTEDYSAVGRLETRWEGGRRIWWLVLDGDTGARDHAPGD